MLISAVEGPVAYAMQEAPQLLHDDAFAAELVALAQGYVAQLGVA